jgi:mannitol/fructose-specific phosphotransferase system IIA component (Ntr-type)
MADLSAPVLALARHQDGVDFEAIDGLPVHIVVLLLVPDTDNRQHLELLAKLARSLQSSHTRDAIMQADSIESVTALFADEVSQQ